MDKKAVLDEITHHYLRSRQFNGVLLTNLGENYEELKETLKQLLSEGKIVLVFGDRHPNPHILAGEPEPKDVQMSKLAALKFEKPVYEGDGPIVFQTNSINCCAYPSREHLKAVVGNEEYGDEPFVKRLALGESQLSHKVFNLGVLEYYRNDPRYRYVADDVQGHITATSEEQLAEEDEIFIQFGFTRDDDGRHVTALLWDLSLLSPKHQQKWNLEIHADEAPLHPDHARTIAGYWREGESVFVAFCKELEIINRMTERVWGKPLFMRTFDGEDRPRKFSLIVRTTGEEYGHFVQLLDKMIWDNLNRKFFKGQMDLTEQVEQDGKTIERNKSPVRLLEEWLYSNVRFQDTEPVDEMIAAFNKVRKQRNKFSHRISDNDFDSEYHNIQRSLMREAYSGVRLLRLIFSNHPLAKDIEVPDWLYEGKIWDS
ncbi:MAG: hypothetical protein MPK06_03395 [Alphaproteobacteria bacterium]|nr:hypothetical protein [Alphaproteobacteria bacterium]MDA8004169.1 hypothetical protein [Alphaproteobacteria bacterium]MDA8005571.1 hypothetical protein [Alphaproteobacteria bacterium]MDA8012584.1 hypothetical protein [Alphaproteobacteria bacterium]